MSAKKPGEPHSKNPTSPVPAKVVEMIRRGLTDRDRISLLVYHPDGAEMVPLLADVPVVIGREAPSDVRLPDPTLSREHVRFAFTDGRITVEDLRSTNGTWIAGRRIESAELKVGDEVMLGGLVVCVHAPGPSESNLGLESEERFRSRLDDEVVRARHFRGRFAVMMVRAVSAGHPGGEPVGHAGLHVGRWAPMLRPHLRAVDRVALYSPDAVQVLLPDAGHELALQTARAITQRRHDDDPHLLVGVAIYPDAATTPEKLIELSIGAGAAATIEQPVVFAKAAAWVTGEAQPKEEPIVAGSALRDVLDTAMRLAKTKVPVILHGETGTGKEVLARLIHESGPRRARPMVCVNCGAIAPQLVESTFFGHERGAFTGASQQQKGVFEEADGGTVFLDEIGELPLAAQAALLRVLETGRFTRVGSSREIAVDVRLVAATHRDLEVMCVDGAFRDDLYYRMSTMTLTIPPLRERRDEIEPLALRFLRMANASGHGHVTEIEPRALALLRDYAWPGNVRELRNAIERAVIVARGDSIREHDLPARVRAVGGTPTSTPALGNVRRSDTGKTSMRDDVPTPVQHIGGDSGPTFKERLQQFEAKLIVEALAAARWNQTEAAKALGMPLRTLVHKIKVLGIKKLPR